MRHIETIHWMKFARVYSDFWMTTVPIDQNECTFRFVKRLFLIHAKCNAMQIDSNANNWAQLWASLKWCKMATESTWIECMSYVTMYAGIAHISHSFTFNSNMFYKLQHYNWVDFAKSCQYHIRWLVWLTRQTQKSHHILSHIDEYDICLYEQFIMCIPHFNWFGYCWLHDANE